MDLGLTGRVAIVTGASEGLGLATARLLLQEGASVAICSRRREAIADAARQLIAETGGNVIGFAADMSKLADIQQFVHQVVEHFGRIDILVNNAGSSIFATFFDIPDENWTTDITTKLIGYVRMCREVIPVMRQTGGGRIVNVAGNAGKQPLTYHMPGAAANAGILNFTKSLSEQVAADGVVINAVAPGPIETGRMLKTFVRLAHDSGSTLDEARLEYAKDLPLRYIPGPDEIANTIVYLASPRAAYMTGTCITIDGGITKGI